MDSEELQYDVFEYLNLTPDQKREFFLKTISSLSFLASYWVNFEKVENSIDSYGPDLYTLDYLIGRSDQEIAEFFQERPHLLRFIPYLLGIREKKLNNGILKVQGITGVHELNFSTIEEDRLPEYLQFIQDSGLAWLFKQGVKKSIHDYTMGVESGMDSNARKNRSGNMGELYLGEVLKHLAEDKNWLYSGQTTKKSVKKDYDIDLDASFGNRRFDGALFNPERRKLYLFEVNNFNGGGSKSKASATEFKDLHDRFSRTNHEFIYITDGDGWQSDKSHLKEAMEYIGKVFNYKMIENNYLTDYLA